jgi:hypothetical protein
MADYQMWKAGQIRAQRFARLSPPARATLDRRLRLSRWCFGRIDLWEEERLVDEVDLSRDGNSCSNYRGVNHTRL